MTYYGQQLEDMYLDRVIGGAENGLFLDIGAHDGLSFSNTLCFEQKGWDGVCIEPHPTIFETLKINRRCRCLQVQVGDHTTPHERFFATDGGYLSSSDSTFRDRRAHYYGHHFAGWHEIDVPMMSTDDIFSVVGRDPTLVSIDVEGSELDVVHGWSMDKWRPRAVVIEIDSQEVMDEIFAMFRKAGYQDCMKQSSNYFFCRDQQDVDAFLAMQR